MNDIDVADFSENKFVNLFEEFQEEVKTAEQEWKDIKRDAQLARNVLLSTNLTPLITNSINILPIGIATTMGLLLNHRYAESKIQSAKVKNPVSVFVDLKNQKQSFFSQLKNCIL